MPGGDTRSATYHKPYPLVIDRGEGAYLWDLDGNRYIDLLGNFTSLVHGNAYPPIIEAVADALPKGTAWAALNSSQIDLADVICERVSSVDMIRYCNSGTEAGMLAAKLARHVTGRHLLLRARTGYHGSYDSLEGGDPKDGMVVADFGSAESFEEQLEAHGDDIAAVFLEPVQGGGILLPDANFFHRVQKAARGCGALFILDEVITLRLGFHGFQSELGLDPDLTMMGKIVGGGFPVGVLGGRTEFMKEFDPSRGELLSLFHSGTFNGNPITATAGLVSMTELTSVRIQELARRGAELRDQVLKAASKVGIPFSLTQEGSLLTAFLQSEIPLPPEERSDRELSALFHVACLNQGLLFAPRGLIVLSTVIGDNLLEEIANRFTAALDDLANDPASHVATAMDSAKFGLGENG